MPRALARYLGRASSNAAVYTVWLLTHSNRNQSSEDKCTMSSSRPSNKLDRFPNPQPARDYAIHMEIPEFTCLCPLTGQPDFAVFELDYIPNDWCVELKALKMYMWSYRDQGAFHEAVTNQILDALVELLAPRYMRLTSRWYVRGGIYTTISAEHRKRGWKAPTPVDLGTLRSEPVRPFSH